MNASLDLIADPDDLDKEIAHRLCTEYLSTLAAVAKGEAAFGEIWTELLRVAIEIVNDRQLVACGCCARGVLLSVEDVDDVDDDGYGHITVDIIRVLNPDDIVLAQKAYRSPPPARPDADRVDILADVRYALNAVLADLNCSTYLSTCRDAAAQLHEVVDSDEPPF
ncbi:hypothetical protein ACFWPH_28285 [Nocardia sp. NPDC058499]|uniref:hypothetical protein n=1 Tax=Nocardia sp. NPDC058499 TaxID=3346530 RepID=UPI0036594573